MITLGGGVTRGGEGVMRGTNRGTNGLKERGEKRGREEERKRGREVYSQDESLSWAAHGPLVLVLLRELIWHDIEWRGTSIQNLYLGRLRAQ
jgi:hypothetical protein